MPDGQRIVQMLIRRRQRSGSDHLYLELDDTRGHYFSAVFDEIVEIGTDDNKMVPAGRLVDRERFRAAATRYRRNVLIDGSGTRDWLPMILVITWQMRGGRAEPLLQLRTQRNATRELDRFTHLAGHITQDKPSVEGVEFGLEDPLPMAAAAQRVQMETGQSDPGELSPMVTGKYFHPDKEHLFFFVYSCQASGWPAAVAAGRDVPAIRARASVHPGEPGSAQGAGAVPGPAGAPPGPRIAFDIVSQNLILHGYPDIAAKLAEAGAARPAGLDAIAAELDALVERTRQVWPTYEGDAEVVGLSGFRFREFPHAYAFL